MRVARRSLALLMASLFAWFGVASAAPLHFHAMDASQSLIAHVSAIDAHDAHGINGHTHDHESPSAKVDGGDAEGDPSDNQQPGEPVAHVHGCFHAATVAEPVAIAWTGMTSLAVWSDYTTALHSISASPPRKPPRNTL